MPRILVVVASAAAFLAAGCMGDDETATKREQTSAEKSTTTTAQMPPPSDFAAKPAGLSVELSWSPPSEAVETFALYRDGTSLARLPGARTTYTDTGDVRPGRTYSYEIEAHAGEAVSQRVSVSVEVPTPPLRAARLEGDFSIKTRALSKSGYGEYTAPTFGWSFRPRCGEGACDVLWRDLHENRIHAKLERRGAHYRGSYTGPFTIECEGVGSTSSVTLELEVTAARADGSTWQATRFEGTLSQSEAAQLGCAPSQAKFAVRGRRVM